MTTNELLAQLTEEMRLLREEVKRLREHQQMTTVHIHNPALSVPPLPTPPYPMDPFRPQCLSDAGTPHHF